VRADAEEDPVGAGAGHAQRLRAAGGDPDGNRAVMRQPRGRGGPDFDRLTVEEPAHQARARLQLRHARGLEPGEPHGRIADAPAEDHAPGRELVDGRDRRRGHRGMPVDRIRQQRAEHDPPRGADGGGEHHVRVPPAQLRVRLQGRVPAEIFRAADVRGEGVDRAGIETVQTEAWQRHGCSLSVR
jgi:hypothetical protein